MKNRINMPAPPSSFRGLKRLRARAAVSQMTAQDLESIGITKRAQALFLESIAIGGAS